MRRFVHQSRFAATPETVFAFHERADILTLLIPRDLNVRIVSRSGGLAAGARAEFRFYFGPFYLTWVAIHTAYTPNRLFVDEQQRGPFATWRHEHLFLPDGDGCILRDSIEYSLPFALDRLLGWFIDRKLRHMFIYRHETTATHLPLT